jgi:glutamyl-tRNA reductase
VEVERTLSRGEWTDAQRKSVEAMARALVNKILHEPTQRIRAAADADDGRILEAVNELFALSSAPQAGNVPAEKSAAEVDKPDRQRVQPLRMSADDAPTERTGT